MFSKLTLSDISGRLRDRGSVSTAQRGNDSEWIWSTGNVAELARLDVGLLPRQGALEPVASSSENPLPSQPASTE